MGCLAAIAHSRLWHLTTDRVLMADGRFQGGAEVRGHVVPAEPDAIDPSRPARPRIGGSAN